MIRVVVWQARYVGVVLVVKATPVMITAAKLNIAGQRIREMNMVM